MLADVCSRCHAMSESLRCGFPSVGIAMSAGDDLDRPTSRPRGIGSDTLDCLRKCLPTQPEQTSRRLLPASSCDNRRRRHRDARTEMPRFVKAHGLNCRLKDRLVRRSTTPARECRSELP
jgi:hypothetical protein